MIHLDCKTEYSFMRGYGSVEKWVARAKEIGAPAIGISDWCSTWGHVPFSKSDINVLYGVQVPVVQTLDKEQTHGIITLLAKRDVKVLYDIVTLAHEQTYYRPRIKWSQLAGLGDDIALIVNECPLGQLANIDKLGFGSIAISPVRSVLHRVIEEFSCIATGGPVYPFVEDREGYDLVQAISSGHRIGEDSPVGYHMLSRQEYEAALLDQGIDVRQGWFDNAEGIVASCNAQIPRASLIHVEGDILELAKQNAKRLGIDLNGPYGDRLQHEVSIIREKNFESYFLFVSDLVNWAKDRMLVGPGRGSAGGSLLCFLLGITDVDPLVHGTLFERFLDPTRSDYPDIDVDFPDNKRELVFTYLGEKYGKDRVARLGTISRFGGKSAITDAGKAFGMSLSIIRDINKLWDAGNDYLAPFFAQLSKDLLEKHPYIVKASLLEDVPRHSGVHAAGVCITSEPISNFGPIDRNGTIALDLHTAESVGLIKMDALGLRTLAVLDAVGHPMPKTFDDPKVWEIFNNDKVTGVFQFEGQAVRGLMRGMKVDRFEDLCALTSLARPGPLVGGAAENYVKRRGNHEEWEYLHPALEEYLNETYGTLVYQEQAMAIVRGLGDFNVAEVNQFRKAVGKKDPVLLASFRAKFIENAGEKIGGDQANELWDEMSEFGSYAFNKSHAVAYSMISYWCAYMKAYHPLEFALAQLNNAADDEQGKALLREMDHEYITFDPNISQVNWSIHDDKLVGGFTSVRGIGSKTAENMISLREEFGDSWMDHLTESQRNKITSKFNTPWDDLNRFQRLYSDLYENPMGYRSKSLPNGSSGPIYKIVDIPAEKGTYIFLGTLKRIQPRTKVDEKGNEQGDFCNLYFEDDTGDIGCTISRRAWPSYKWLLEDDYENKDFIVKGAQINDDGRVWLFIEKLIQLK